MPMTFKQTKFVSGSCEDDVQNQATLTLASMSPKSSSFCLRGVFSAIWVEIDLWMSPMAVRAPVRVTTAWAVPLATVVP